MCLSIDPEVLNIGIVFLASYFAFTLSALSGGGAGLFLIPVLSELIPVSRVPAALSIGTFSGSISKIYFFKKYIQWKIVRHFLPPAIPAVWLGAYLLKFLNPLYLKLFMGVFLLSNLGFLFKKKEALEESITPATYKLVLVGFLAGFLSGLIGAIGLVFNRFYLRYGLSKEEIIATRAANEISLHFFKIILYSLFGLLNFEVFVLGITVALSGIVSTMTVKYILPLISEFFYKRIGYSAMVLTGMLLIYQTTPALLEESRNEIRILSVNRGFETKFRWQESEIALEFTFDEGFEYEQVIPISELSDEQKTLVLSRRKDADQIIIEAVYSIGSKTYEAEYYLNGKRIDSIEFE